MKEERDREDTGSWSRGTGPWWRAGRLAVLALGVPIVACVPLRESRSQFLFEPPVVVDPGWGQQSKPSLAVDPEGNPCIVYDLVERGYVGRVERVDGERGIRFTRSTDGGVSFPITTWADSSNTFCAPRLAVDCRGDPHIVYTFERGRDRARYVRSTDGGRTFLPGILIPPDTLDQRNPDIALAFDGTPFAAWDDGADVYVSRSTDGGRTFLAPVRLGHPELIDWHPTVAVDGDGDPHIAWMRQQAPQSDRFSLSYARSEDRGRSFLPSYEVGAGTADRSAPRLAIDSASNPVLVWTDERSSSPYFARSADGGRTFSTGHCVGTDRVWGAGASVALDGAENPVVAWREEGRPFWNVCVSRSTDRGRSFLPGVLADSIDAAQVNAAVACGPEGGVMVVWEDARPPSPFDTDIYFARGSPAQIAPGILRGTVRDAETGGALGALLTATRHGFCGPPDTLCSDPVSGEFERELLPGTYDVEVTPCLSHCCARLDDLYVGSGSTIVLDLLLSKADLLLVVDDGGAGYEHYYAGVLDSLGVEYRAWRVTGGGPFPVGREEVGSFPTIVWFTGDETEETLTRADRDGLAAFLAAGGRLFLSGQYLAEEIGGSSFFRDWLCAEFDAVSDWPGMYGEPGDPIGDGLAVAIAGAGGAWNQVSPDEVRVLDPGRAVFRYLSGAPSAVRAAHPRGRAVYFAFGFEAISRNAPAQASREEVMAKVLGWLETPTGVPEEKGWERGLEASSTVWSVRPNPFREEVAIEYEMGDPASLEIVIYNILGQRVRRLVDGSSAAGRFRVEWSGRDEEGHRVANGIYLVRLRAEGGGQACEVMKKIVLLR
jgi:hypothetical protein